MQYYNSATSKIVEQQIVQYWNSATVNSAK